MAIWPWRSRPTVQPWRDDYNLATLSLPAGLTPIASIYNVPDNIFAHPILIHAQVTNVAGVRVNQFIDWTVTRSNSLIAASSLHVNTTAGIIAITYAVGYVGYFFATRPQFTTGYFPQDLLLLPGDIFTFNVTGGLAGDTLDHCNVTAKYWEVY